MSFTPKSIDVISLNDSWVDVNDNDNVEKNTDTPMHVLVRSTIPTHQSLERLLLDAQKESVQSSLKGSHIGSTPISPDGLQTPPNSLYCNNELVLDRNQLNTDWIWDWSNRDGISKDWSGLQPIRKSRLSLRQWVIRRGILSNEVLSLLFLTNVLSLLLGAGIGYTIIVRRSF